jgi:Tripartite tricarboxylate transporter TctB family
MRLLRSPKEFYAGLVYIAFGAAGLWFGAAYPMGTAGRMGSGYFPKILAALLLIFGAIAILRSFRVEGGSMEPIRWKPLLLILAGCSLFGILLQPLGMPIALFILILCCAMASREFRWSASALSGAVLAVALCTLVFIKGLSVQMPLIGDWIAPLFLSGTPR